MKTLALSLIKLYQLALRPVLPARCRFFPSCSDYAAQAVAELGVLHGGSTALLRLSKCHPFHPGGYDPLTKHG